MGLAPVIEALDWPDFIEHLKAEWEPGQHMGIISPTGQGKTTVLVSILKETGRKWVLAFDPKGGDSTLASLGWPRIPRVPQQKKWWQVWRRDPFERMAEGEPFRAIVGPIVRTAEDRAAMVNSFRFSLREIYDQGGWTVAVDEFQILSDKRIMGLATEVETLLIAARDKGVSVITLFQAPRWVPRAAADQAEWLLIGLTRDRDVVDRISEILGRSLAEVQGAIEGLASRDYAWLVARNNPRKPLIVTRPPPVPRRPVRNT